MSDIGSPFLVKTTGDKSTGTAEVVERTIEALANLGQTNVYQFGLCRSDTVITTDLNAKSIIII